MHNGLNKIEIQSTREPEMGYAKIETGLWMFISLQDGRKAQVGPQYATKSELLADTNRYLASWGY